MNRGDSGATFDLVPYIAARRRSGRPVVLILSVGGTMLLAVWLGIWYFADGQVGLPLACPAGPFCGSNHLFVTVGLLAISAFAYGMVAFVWLLPFPTRITVTSDGFRLGYGEGREKAVRWSDPNLSCTLWDDREAAKAHPKDFVGTPFSPFGMQAPSLEFTIPRGAYESVLASAKAAGVTITPRSGVRYPESVSYSLTMARGH